MPLQEKQLGQLRPANTNAASIYTPGAGVTVIIRNITVANTSAAQALFRIFCHNTGSTYDQGTALFYDVPIQKYSTMQVTAYMAMNNSSGNLAVQTSVANALTFTVFGAEVT
jgi:hypothetical protein